MGQQEREKGSFTSEVYRKMLKRITMAMVYNKKMNYSRSITSMLSTPTTARQPEPLKSIRAGMNGGRGCNRYRNVGNVAGINPRASSILANSPSVFTEFEDKKVSIAIDSAMSPWTETICSPEKRSCVSLHRAFARDLGEIEFLQATTEVMGSIEPLIAEEGKYYDIFLRMLEPERVIMFRVPWTDDDGKLQINRGFRVQMNSALGPYKGGLRFHKNVNLSTMKFLAFEQTLKNALTGMSIGSGKGGSDFDPKGKSDAEIMRFCQSFMIELHTHLGPNLDVPAGDIGVGAREIGYLFGQYKRLSGRFEGAITGKGVEWGGSFIRPEATGYGLVYFVECMIAGSENPETIRNKRISVSGSGNVAQFAAEKAIQLGAKVLTMSDSHGTVYQPSGFSLSQLDELKTHKNLRRGRLADLPSVEAKKMEYFPNERPWAVAKCDIALPCATQNELDIEDAEALIRGGTKLIAEGANMPITPGALALLQKFDVSVGPAKAANAGGVAVSGLEMAQNATFQTWRRDDVDAQLKSIMSSIYNKASAAAKSVGREGDLRCGADVAGFQRVADAMLAQGYV